MNDCTVICVNCSRTSSKSTCNFSFIRDITKAVYNNNYNNTTTTTRRSTLGDRSFPVAVVRGEGSWNALPQHVRNVPLFPSSAENWRPFCSDRRSLMRSDNVLCFICASVAQCWSVTMYWLLQTEFVDIVRCSCSSCAIMPPK